MGREGENLPLARAIRPSVAGAVRRELRLADYTGGRLSFGNERAAPLVFPSAPIAHRRERRHGARCGSPHGIFARERAPVRRGRCGDDRARP